MGFSRSDEIVVVVGIVYEVRGTRKNREHEMGEGRRGERGRRNRTEACDVVTSNRHGQGDCGTSELWKSTLKAATKTFSQKVRPCTTILDRYTDTDQMQGETDNVW